MAVTVSKSEANEIHIGPQEGPQMQACLTKADICIYGGQAGGGKSWFLVAEPTRRTHHPGFSGVIFRRTYPQLLGQGGIWQEANKLYRALGARMREGDALDATFQSGAQITFRHLQHEKTKYEYQGHQFTYIGFDELCHFTETQFFYLLSRNRNANCPVRGYVRATCNPDAGSWVAEFIAWWIDQDSGLPIPERSGKLRYFVREEDKMHWADTKQELVERFKDYEPSDILSVTFIPATLEDNKVLCEKDPGYRAKLKALPRIERERLLGGNWKASEGSLIETDWLKFYTIVDGKLRFSLTGHVFEIPIASCRRFATIDTAGTSKEKAAELRGDPPSWSVCAVWDALPHYVTTADGARVVLSELLFLRHVWRAQVDWNQLKAGVPEVLQTWNVQRAYIENAHYGQPLSKEIKGCATELIGPVISGMDDSSRGAKLERAVASGMLSRVENGKLFLPAEQLPWLPAYKRELTVWTGLPKETADQIDVTSYACYISRKQSTSWGGTIPHHVKGARA